MYNETSIDKDGQYIIAGHTMRVVYTEPKEDYVNRPETRYTLACTCCHLPFGLKITGTGSDIQHILNLYETAKRDL